MELASWRLPRIYVAATFDDGVDVQFMCSRAAELLLSQTVHWWEHEGPNVDEKFGRIDADGVKSADFFAMYHSGKRSAGKYIEMGIAIALGKPIFTFGEDLTTVFRCFVDRHFHHDVFDPEKAAEQLYVAISEIYAIRGRCMLCGDKIHFWQRKTGRGSKHSKCKKKLRKCN